MQLNTGKRATLSFLNEASGDTFQHELQENASVIVGRDASCSMVLEDPMVSGRHCMFRFADDGLHVCDWHSEHGTIVNDQPIVQETSLQPGDQLSVGSFDVSWTLDGVTLTLDAHQKAPVVAEPSPVTETQTRLTATDAVPISSVPSLSEHPDTFAQAGSNHLGKETDWQQQLDTLQAENEQLREELERMLDSESADLRLDSPLDLDQQEVELLRAEVSQLQSELAERDLELTDLLADDSMGEPVTAPIENHETERLVDRLEALLDELQLADRRTRSMDELLRAAAEAQQAELEERQQIERWLGEIESRIGRREEEWQSQNEQLLQRVGQLESEREKSRKQLSAALRSSGNQMARQVEAQLETTRNENESLRSRLQVVEQEHEQANCRLREFEEELQNGESAASLRKRLREQELEMVQERAAISRQKAELVRMRDDLERATSSSPENIQNSDVRVKALRDHLREIHDQEKEQKQSGGGFASRLTRLWSRLDSR